jgi:hypothetical protein
MKKKTCLLRPLRAAAVPRSVIGLLLGVLVANPAGAAPSSPVYRFWNPVTAGFFLTISPAEVDALITAPEHNWQLEGVAWQAYETPTHDTKAIARFWRDDLQRHFFTANPAEIAALQAPGSPWRYEGTAWYSPPLGACGVGPNGEPQGLDPVFRYWNEGLQAHFFTAAQSEVAHIFANLPEWRFESLVWSAPGAHQTSQRVLSITDVHFNPFADPDLVADLAMMPGAAWDDFLAMHASTELPKTGQPTNYALLTTILENARLRVPAPDFILYTGDFLAHGFNRQFAATFPDAPPGALEDFILKTVTFLTTKLRATYPQAPIFFTLGNNDSFAGDYALVDGGPFLERTAEIFLHTWLGTSVEPADYLTSYLDHGNFSATMPGVENGRLISFNSVFFSPRHPDEGIEATMDAQLDWLEAELDRAAAAGEQVWLLSHIPPSVDVFATLRSQPRAAVSQWREETLPRYLDIVRDHAPTIVFGQAGHTHMDDFRLVSQAGGPWPDEEPELIKITPSVTPLFGNNPAYQVYGYDSATGEVIDIDTFYLNLSDWDGSALTQPSWVRHEYDFSATYGLPPDAWGFNALYQSLPFDPARRDSYLLHYGSANDPSGIAADWEAYWCGIGALTTAEYRAKCPAVFDGQ